MAIYHLSVKYVSRKQGRSAVAAAAYRSGEKLYNRYDGLTYDFTHKKGIIYTKILLPINAPFEFMNRETLWNAVEMAEKRSDSRTAREIEVALPNELTVNERIELVENYAIDNFINKGMCADVAIHSGHRICQNNTKNIESENNHPDNPHAHILLTTRTIEHNGFSNKKNRDWDKRENVTIWRKKWAEVQSKEFERNGLNISLSHESYALQNIDKEPTIHLGRSVMALERRGIRTDRSNKNHMILAERECQKYEHQKELERSRDRGRERSR